MFNIDGFCPTIKPQIGLQTQFIINCHKIGFFLRNKGNRCSTGQRPRGLIKNLVFSLSHYSNVGVHNTSDRSTPLADSPDNITQSQLSQTAFATSQTSALAGRGNSVMVSNI